MKVLKEIISTLKNAKIHEVRTCVRWTAVVSEIGYGLASTLQNKSHCDDPEKLVRNCGALTNKSGLELAEYVFSDNLLEASIGMATINSLIQIDNSKVLKEDILEILHDKIENKNITMIGHFPIVKKLKELAKNLWIIEQNPSEGDLNVEEGKKVIPKSDLVIITGTSLINHTFMNILDLCNKDSYKVLLGPSTPISPILFEYGINMISGIKIVDIDKVFHYIGQGASFKQIKGVEKISLHNLLY